MKIPLSLLITAMITRSMPSSGQLCSGNLVANGGFESTPGYVSTAACNPLAIPNWTTYIPEGSIEVLVRNAQFPMGNYGPESWDADPVNNLRIGRCFFGGMYATNNRGIFQQLATPLTAGKRHVVRVRYAATSTVANVNSVTMQLRGSQAPITCPNPGPFLMGSELFPISSVNVNSPGFAWQTLTAVYTPTTTVNYIQLNMAISVQKGTYIRVFFDDIEVVEDNCPYDLNNNGLVDVVDLQILLGHYGQNVDNIVDLCEVGADVDNSGTVDVADVNMFNAMFGAYCSDIKSTVATTTSDTPALELMCAPNPAEGTTMLYHGPVSAGARVEVYSSTGALIARRSANGNGPTPVDLRGFEAGHYVFRIVDGAQQAHVRVMVE